MVKGKRERENRGRGVAQVAPFFLFFFLFFPFLLVSPFACFLFSFFFTERPFFFLGLFLCSCLDHTAPSNSQLSQEITSGGNSGKGRGGGKVFICFPFSFFFYYPCCFRSSARKIDEMAGKKIGFIPRNS